MGPATLMLSDEYPESHIQGPRSIDAITVTLHLHVSNVDRLFDQAILAGATIVRPLEDQFYGERSGTVRDPLGYEWLLGGQLEEVSTDEMQRRCTALLTKE